MHNAKCDDQVIDNIVALIDQRDTTTEDGIALEFARTHQGTLVWVQGWGRWLQFDGARWRADRTISVMDLARKLCRECAACDDDGKKAKVMRSAATIAAVERLARCDRRLAEVPESFDVDPWKLNTPGGVVDLSTGAIALHDPKDLMTKVTSVAPGGSCPAWLTFLGQITGGNEDLMAFLQRVVGYALTGSVVEHALFFFYGAGGNGKSVFLALLKYVFGDYAGSAAMDTFTASKGDRHPADLAALRGARLVTASETEQGRRWDEARLKALTGGDAITARFMRGDFFTFDPTFTILVAGNHKPQLRSVDQAIRRRLHLVPFTVTIPAEDRDPDLAEKLKAEAGGILQWAIEGCLAWQISGLNPPAAVLDATSEYLEDQDAFQAWIEDCCTVDADRWELASTLYESWRNWAERAGEFVVSLKQFTERLDAAGFDKRKTNGVKRRMGLCVKQ